MQMIGQEKNLELIDKWKTLPQFIIITGDRHTGKSYFVTYLCEKFGLYYHRMDNKVDSIRNLLDVMGTNANTVYHFKDFQEASFRAKGALLKICEEPIEGNYIIITGSSQLNTLESRARKIVMNPYTENDVKSYMKKYIVDEDFRDMLYKCGINTPAKVEYYGKYANLQDIAKEVSKIFTRITYLTIDDVIRVVNDIGNTYDDTDTKIDKTLLFYEMLINYIEYDIKESSYSSYYEILKILIEEKNKLIKEPTLNKRFSLYRAFHSICLHDASVRQGLNI